MRKRRIIAFILTAVMLIGTLAGCGTAYDHANDYLTLPTDIKSVQVKMDDVLKDVQDRIKTLLENAAGQVFEPVTDPDAVAQKGDEVRIKFTGTTSLSEEAYNALTETVKNRLKNEDGYYLVLGSDNTLFPVDYTNKNDDTTDNDKDDETVIVEGFENQLIAKGAKVGDKFSITAKFDNAYSQESLRNVEVTYEVEILSIARITLSDEHSPKIDYTFFQNKEDVEDILEPVIDETEDGETEGDETEGEAGEPAAASESAESTADASAADSATESTADSSAADDSEETPKKFSDLFSSKTGQTIDLSSGSTTFANVFTVDDIAPYLAGKHLYDKFAIALTVPDDLASADYKGYLGQEIYLQIEITGDSAEPVWTDYFITKQTASQEDEEDRYTTTAAYEEYLQGEYKKSEAFEAINDASEVVYPEKEWEELYESNLMTEVCDYLAENDPNASEDTSVSLSDYTPDELKELIDEATYQELRLQASAKAKESIKSRLTMEALFIKYADKVAVSDAEYNERVDELKEEYESMSWLYEAYYGIRNVNEYIDSMYGGKDSLMLQLKYEKLLDILPDEVTYLPATEEPEEN